MLTGKFQIQRQTKLLWLRVVSTFIQHVCTFTSPNKKHYQSLAYKCANKNIIWMMIMKRTNKINGMNSMNGMCCCFLELLITLTCNNPSFSKMCLQHAELSAGNSTFPVMESN